MTDVVYSARNVNKVFGPTVALHNVCFEVRKGRVLGLIGMNGAGKSTLLRIMAGALGPDQGTLTLEGETVQFSSTSEARRCGVSMVSQELNLFPALTVSENLKIVSSGHAIASDRAFRAKAAAVLAELGFLHDLDVKVEKLTLADRQMVEIARALLQSPRVLVLDEPTSSLHASEVARLHEQIRRLSNLGVAIIYVTHFLEDLLDICDDVLVLRNGRRVDAPDLSRPDRLPALVEAMLGEPVQPAEQQLTEKTVTSARADLRPLSVAGLIGPGDLRVPNFVARPGEIVGLAGLVGAGVDDFFKVLFGLARAQVGEIGLPSGFHAPRTPTDAVRAKVAYAPADRKQLGLMQRQSIAENIASVRMLAQGQDGNVPSKRKMRAYAQRRCEELGVKMSSVDQLVSTLSGGNQQKVVLAKWLEANPSLLLLDDPTRGIDVRARLEIHAIVRQLASQGMVVLFYSTDPGEVAEVADRAVVFVDGELLHEVASGDLSEHTIVTLMNSSRMPDGTRKH